MNLVDKLLQIDKEEPKKKITGEYESKRLKEMIGDGTILIEKIPERKIKEYQAMIMDNRGSVNNNMIFDGMLLIDVEGIKNPNLKNQELMEHFGAATPKDLAEILFDGEIEEIGDAIVSLGKDEDVTDTVKN